MAGTKGSILDASCLLNLYATGFFLEIATAQPQPFAVADVVLEKEALYIRNVSSDPALSEKQVVDLRSVIEKGILKVLRPETEDELTAFVDLAANLGDGESATGALAIHRAWSVATDDRKARKVIAQYSPGIHLTSTLELLKMWVDTSAVDPDKVDIALHLMIERASYLPSPRAPLWDWFKSVFRSSESS